MATDEGIYLARVAFRDPSHVQGIARVQFTHGTKVMWEGGIDDVQAFAQDIGAAVMDAVEWTVC